MELLGGEVPRKTSQRHNFAFGSGAAYADSEQGRRDISY